MRRVRGAAVVECMRLAMHTSRRERIAEKNGEEMQVNSDRCLE